MADRGSSSRMRETTSFGTDPVEDEVTGVSFDILDDDDDILMQADDGTYCNQSDENDAGFDTRDINFDEEMEDVESANLSLGICTDPIAAETDQDLQESGFDFSAGKLWIYPTNYPVRDYQYNIVQKALYNNTLVVLPTGLGKTFIAAVVMYNFFRWFPQGKIVFMAPTKPLVAQQIQACYNIMGIPKADTIEMTGTMAPGVRQKAWKEKRVVFLTPQVMTNDLSRGSLTANSIKCLVLDEAHKATGNHAYCQVVRELVKFTRQCRILALSATPGGDLKTVQQVMNNLLISHIELRSEESIDICPYTHERKVEKIVIPLGEELSSIKLKYAKIMSCVVQRLIRNKVLYNRDVSKVSTGSLLKARVAFRQNPPHDVQQVQRGAIEADFSTAISLCYGFALLQNHGLRSLYNYLSGIITGEKGYGQTRYELMRNADFNDIVEMLRQKFLVSSVDGASLAAGDQKVVVSHPKVQRLEDIVVAHFRSFQNKGEETRVMIFSEYRDSVQEIASVLNQHQPLIKAMPFIGQSSAGKSSKGYTQKDQLMVMKQFREGGYNTLVSTCVGEEGLDIGDVDLIICFDAHKSPVRLVQRMGRTGRKRKGRIVMLVTEGKEEQVYNQSIYSMKSIHKAILNGARSLQFYPNNPRMVPPSVTPQCHKMHITLAVESSGRSKKTPRKSKDHAGSKSMRISDVFSNQVNRAAESEYLTAEEYSEIRKEFLQMSSTAKYLPRPKCITLSSITKNLHDKPEDDTSRQIDFAEWMPWQNSLQSTRLIGHSIQSVHLVKTAEFIGLQQCLGEKEDNYGFEMNRILNVKDNGDGNDHSHNQSSMVSFLTNVQDTSETKHVNSPCPGRKMMEAKNSDPGHGQDKRKRVPKSLTKGTIVDGTHTEALVISSDSSLDGKPTEKGTSVDNTKPSVSRLFTELNDQDKKPNIQNLRSSKKGGKAGSVSSRRLNCKNTTNKQTKGSRSGQKVKFKGKTMKRKSILPLLESSSSRIPSEDDNDDFETDCPSRKGNGSCVINSEKASISNERMQQNTDKIIDSIALDFPTDSIGCKIMTTEGEDFGAEISNNQSKESNANHCAEMDNSTDAIQSNANHCAEMDNSTDAIQRNANHCKDVEQSTFVGSSEAFYVPPPPPISGVKELLQGLRSGKDFADLDLEELIGQWKRSDRKICKGGGSNDNVLFFGERRSDLRFVPINYGETEQSLSNTGRHGIVSKEKDADNRVVRSCDGDSVLPPRESLSTQLCVAAAETAEQRIPKSPSFKGLVRKSGHRNKQTLGRSSSSPEVMRGQRNEETMKLVKRQHGVAEDSSYSKKHSEKNHPNYTRTSHQVQLPTPPLNDSKADSFTELLNHPKPSSPPITRKADSFTEHLNHPKPSSPPITRKADSFTELLNHPKPSSPPITRKADSFTELLNHPKPSSPPITRKADSFTELLNHPKPSSPPITRKVDSFTELLNHPKPSSPPITRKVDSFTELLNHPKLSSPPITRKADSFTKHLKRPKISSPPVTELDELEINMNVSGKDTSPGKFHESFVTFSQAMECLQTSSSEEALIDYNISTPRFSSSKFEISYGRRGFKLSPRLLDMESSCIGDLPQQELRTCNQGVKSAVQRHSQVDINLQPRLISAANTSASPPNTRTTVSKSFCGINQNQLAPDVDLMNSQSTGFPLSPSMKRVVDSPVSRSSRNDQTSLDIPQFDLGFDLDDEEDVIPPTPSKNVSQESVFGFKTFTTSRNLPDGTDTSSPSSTSDKTPEVSKQRGRFTLEGNCSNLGVDPAVVNAFDLQLSSDEDTDWNLYENDQICLSQKKHSTSEVNSINQQMDKEFCNDNFNVLQINHTKKKLFENLEVALCEPEKNEFEFEFEKNETDLVHSSLRKKNTLPFDMYRSNLENELKSTTVACKNTASDEVSSREHSSETLLRPGKLRLGKRLQHFPEPVCQKKNLSVVDRDVDEYRSHTDNCKTSRVLKSFNETAGWDKQASSENKMSGRFSSDRIEKVTASSLGFTMDSRSVGMIQGPSVVKTDTGASASALVDTDSAPVVQASTPVRDTPRNSGLKYVLDDAGDMPLLTPIRAEENERESDSDHSFFIRRRKRTAVLDVSSELDTTAEKSTVKTASGRVGIVCSFQQSESCTVKGMKKSCSNEAPQVSVSDSFGDDIDDFADNPSVSFQPKQHSYKKRRKFKRTKEAANFIEKEAEVSGDDVSSDEYEEVNDFYESSFIDNNTEMTQTQGADMKAMYLKSIKSPVLGGVAARYKMQFNANSRQEMDVYSQTLPEDHGLSEYEEDSFCVGSNEEDVTFSEEESRFAKPKEQKFSRTGKRPAKRKNNRIKVVSNSSSEEDKDIQLTQEFNTAPCKNGRRVLLSSSEDEESEANVLSSNKKTADNLIKSCRTFSSESCNSDTTKLKKMNMAKIAVVSDESEKREGNIDSSVSNQGLRDCPSANADVGNFDIFEDWFDDFDLPEVDSTRRSLVRPLSEDKLETKALCEEGMFHNLNSTPSKCANSSNENDRSSFKSTDNDNYMSSAYKTSYKLQQENSSRSCSVSPITPEHFPKLCSKLQQENSSRSCSVPPITPEHFPKLCSKLQQENSSRSCSVSPITPEHVSKLCINYKDSSSRSKSEDILKINREPSPKGHPTHYSVSTSPVTTGDYSTSCAHTSTFSTAIGCSQTSLLKTNCNEPTVAMTREERLRRQKEKQETYRKKLQQVQQTYHSSITPDSPATSLVIPDSDSARANAGVAIAAHILSNRTSDTPLYAQGQTLPVFTKLKGNETSGHQLQILVDSREISGAQEIISALRLKHSIAVTARQLSCCDYILSNHLAADRIQWSSFSSSSHRSKLSSRLGEMQALYERCVLVVEADRLKTGQEKSKKPAHRTKYLDTTLSYLAQSKVKVYFTDNAEETANILADLCHVEKMKGRALNVPIQLSNAKEEAFKFILSVPGVTVPQALNLAHRSRSIVELLSSPAGVIQERGCMTLTSAQALHEFLHHKVDVHAMTASKS